MLVKDLDEPSPSSRCWQVNRPTRLGGGRGYCARERERTAKGVGSGLSFIVVSELDKLVPFFSTSLIRGFVVRVVRSLTLLQREREKVIRCLEGMYELYFVIFKTVQNSVFLYLNMDYFTSCKIMRKYVAS